MKVTGLRCVLPALCILLLCAPLGAQQDLERLRADMRGMLKTVSSQLEKNFYDPKMKGLDWPALVQTTRQRIDHAGSANEMLGAVFALVRALDDSHTILLPPQRIDRPRFGFEAKAYGDEVRVYEMKKGGAAEAAGLKIGDRLLVLNGIRVERTTFDLLLLHLRALQPVVGMEVVYSRDGGSPQKLLMPAQIKKGSAVLDFRNIENIWNILREIEGQREYFHYFMHADQVGYLQLPYFPLGGDEYRDLANKVDGARAMIIDLRGNGGGYEDGLRAFCGHFEATPGKLADRIDRKKTEALQIVPRKPAFGGPMFVLVDSQTGSAAEMFARHFQRTGRATVIGDKTSGRVTASRFFIEELGVGTVSTYAIQIGMGRVVFPNGEELEKRGVTPDVPCMPTSEDLKANRDPCRQRAISMARKALGLPEEHGEGKFEDKKW